MSSRLTMAALAMIYGCPSMDNGLLSPLPNNDSCRAHISLRASANATAAPDGSVDVSGVTLARDGIAVRAVYVGTVPVPLTEFNYRTWSVHVPAESVAVATRDGRARLSVIAYTSNGCAELSPPLVVTVSGAPILDAGSVPGSDISDAALPGSDASTDAD